MKRGRFYVELRRLGYSRYRSARAAWWVDVRRWWVHAWERGGGT